MFLSQPLRERLTSGSAAIGVQAGLLGLLLYSFNMVRQLPAEKETILVLPPLARPAQPPPMVINARGRAKAPPAMPLPLPNGAGPSAVTAPAATENNAAIQTAPADCIPQGQARPAWRIACPLPAPPAKTGEIPLSPDSHVKDEAHWQQEWEREHSDYLPGVTAGEHSVHVELYNSNGPSLLGGYREPAPYATHAHSSDADFQNALAAWQARQQTLYPHAPAAPAAAP